jgi:hypothetical protein
MEELFSGKPAKFPANNIEEQRSVYKLLDLIDNTFVKPDPKLIDKFPNTDGEFTITDFEQYPIGKLDVQIKTLPAKNVDTPKYQCDIKFLKFCETSLLPVILIIVNAENEVAYWYHIDRDTLVELKAKLNGDSINIDIPKKNIISRFDTTYVGEWTTILKTYISRKIDSEVQGEYKQKYEKLYSELADFPKPVHTINKENLKTIALFLDTLNNALDNDFQVIKEVKYYNFWKLSITYTDFTEKSLAFLLIPIPWGTNDLLIREALRRHPFDEVILSSVAVMHNIDNPILTRPVAYAYKWIKQDVSEILKNRAMVLYSEEICIEHITDFFDYYHRILPLEYNDKVLVSEYLRIVEDYLPTWLTEYGKMRHIPVINGSLYIDLDRLKAHLNSKDVKYINTVTQRRLDSNNKTTYSIKDLGKVTRYTNLLTSLKVLQSFGINEVIRPYLAKGKNGQMKTTWDLYSPESAFIKLSFVYRSLPIVYNAFVKSFFPRLFNDLDFYVDSDLIIVNITYQERYTSPYDSPSIDLFHLQSNVDRRGEVLIFFNGKDCPIQEENKFTYFDNDLIIGGIKYRLKSSQSRTTRRLYEPYMLWESLYELLQQRFDSYFATKTNGIQ